MAAEHLSARELEVLRLTALGHRMKAIGRQLGISDKTVSAYRMSAFRLIGARHSVDATRWAIAHGLVPVPTPEAWH